MCPRISTHQPATTPAILPLRINRPRWLDRSTQERPRRATAEPSAFHSLRVSGFYDRNCPAP
jgi:hypothetical protein